jgi:RNA polymerase sigma factor (TIGR02999 family)
MSRLNNIGACTPDGGYTRWHPRVGLSQADSPRQARTDATAAVSLTGEDSHFFTGRRDPVPSMSDVTQVLSAIEQGDPCAAERLLPLVYNELRRLAAERMAHEQPGRTLQATALVHEAYLRLVDQDKIQRWDGRGHFFAAAAEAMRRILVEEARRKRQLKRGGNFKRHDLDDLEISAQGPTDDVVALDEALNKLAEKHPEKAELVKLRYFAGFTIPEAAHALAISTTTAERYWTFARAWLFRELALDEEPEPAGCQGQRSRSHVDG